MSDNVIDLARLAQSLTLNEMDVYREKVGVHLGHDLPDDVSPVLPGAVMYYLIARRSNPTLTFDQVRDMPTSSILEFLGVEVVDSIPLDVTPGNDRINATSASSSAG